MLNTENQLIVFHVRSPLYYRAEEGVNDTTLDQDVREYYKVVRDEQAKSGYTLAFENRVDGWHVAYSHTASKTVVNAKGKKVHADPFCRRIGRAIAVGRLKCHRKCLSQYYGTEAPTWEDAVVLVELIKCIEFYEHLEGVFPQGHADRASKHSERFNNVRSRSQARRLHVQQHGNVQQHTETGQ